MLFFGGEALCTAQLMSPRSANVEYIKWDMNRPLTEVYSLVTTDSINDPVWQSETAHRYVLGVYQLQSRITKAFPNILLENCASGGGRFDPGMLYFSPQIWCSDVTDAVVRMRIQYGTSIAYPTRCIGAHVSAVPNHITGNLARPRTTGLVAMCGTFGFELDMTKVCGNDKLQFQRQVEVFKALSPIIWWGDLYRIWNPFHVCGLAACSLLTAAGALVLLDVCVQRQVPRGGVRLLYEQRPLEQSGAQVRAQLMLLTDSFHLDCSCRACTRTGCTR